MNRSQYRLYAITDRSWLNGRTLEDALEEALRGGVTLVQLREKNLSQQEYIARAKKIKIVCDAFAVPLIINDNAVVAREAAASGVHLGQADGDLHAARSLLGEKAIIGATARTVDSARAAQAAGADYIGCGAVFGTQTKQDAQTISPAQFAQVAQAVNIPVVAIGGVNAQNASMLKGCGAAGLCVVSALFAQEDIESAAHALSQAAQEVCKG